MAEQNSNPWFTSPSNALNDIAGILISLREKGLIDGDMSVAIHKHAENLAGNVPSFIRGIGATMASAAAGNFGVDNHDMASCAWGVQELTSLAQAAQDMEY